MLTITAVIRARKGEERALRDALLEVADNVRANEPDTVGFFISQDLEDPCVFTTYERFTDRAAMYDPSRWSVLSTRIADVSGVDRVGFIPEELQTKIGFAAGLGVAAKEVEAAKAKERSRARFG